MITTEQQNTLIVILFALVVFGIVFDRYVGRIEDEDPDHGYTAIWVVFGVLITLAAMSTVIGWFFVILVLAGFVASGAPMILGSIRRHLRNRRKDRIAAAADLQEAIRGD